MEHEATTCRVYVKTDDAGLITDINSSAFLADPAGWTCIDEGAGDRYAHAQGNYLPGPLRDALGIPCYKLSGGMAIARAPEEMQSDAAALPQSEPSNTELLLEIAANHEYRLCIMELGLNESEVI